MPPLMVVAKIRRVWAPMNCMICSVVKYVRLSRMMRVQTTSTDYIKKICNSAEFWVKDRADRCRVFIFVVD